jgi:hypothetical protein
VWHFKTLKEANEKRREQKREYYEDYLEYMRECGEHVPEDIDDLDDDKLVERVYSNAYMDMRPFSAIIHEIKIEEDAIVKTRVPFPTKSPSKQSSDEDL